MADRKAPHGLHRQHPASEAWDTLPWRKLERHVFRIQKRIYRARQRGNIRAVQKLQKLLLKSEAARLLAVRTATRTQEQMQRANGRQARRVHARQRFALVRRLHPQKPAPGLSTPLARAREALVNTALLPCREAILAVEHPGLGPGQSCQDTLKTIYQHTRDLQSYVFVASIRHGFASVDHHALLAKLQAGAGLRRMVRAMLKAGLMHDLSSMAATNGPPQRDPLPLLLAQIALSGIEQAVRPADLQGDDDEQALVIGYADHFVLFHPRLADLTIAASRAEVWLNSLGLQLERAHTYITHTLTPYQGRVGFTFAGYTLRQYPAGRSTGSKTELIPGKEAIREHLQALGKRIRACRAASQETLIRELNPLIEEWADCYGLATSADAHARCDHIMHQQLLSWARSRHPRKGMAWLIAKYWPQNSWTFCCDHARLRRHSEMISRPTRLSQPSTTSLYFCEQESRGWQHALTLDSGERTIAPLEANNQRRATMSGISHT